MKKVYILFSRTDTIPAKAIRLFTTGPFSHISIAIRPDTGGFYSYARRKINNPFISGLIAEDTHKNIFAKYPDTPAALYELEVTDEAYDSIQSQICYYWEHEKEATYNFAGMVPMLLGIPIRRKFKFTCSQFVAVLLQNANAVKLPKNPYIMKPNDFLTIKELKPVYKGCLKDCHFPQEAPEPANEQIAG